LSFDAAIALALASLSPPPGTPRGAAGRTGSANGTNPSSWTGGERRALSLEPVLGRHALTATLVVLLVAAGASLRLPAPERNHLLESGEVEPRGRRFRPGGGVPIFTALDLRLAFGDVLAIWAGRPSCSTTTAPSSGRSHHWLLKQARYPELVPLFEALVARIRETWDFGALKPIFALFFLSLLIGTARAARTFGSPAAAMGAAAVAGFLPALSTSWNLGGYADLPEAAVVAVAAVAWLHERKTVSWRSPGPWLLGTLLMVKSEGVIPFGVAAGVFLAAVTLRRAESFPSRVWSAAVPPALFLACRVAYLRVLDLPGPQRLPLSSLTLGMIAKRCGLIASNGLRWLLAPELWGVLWPAFFAAAVILLATEGERALAAITLLCVVGYATPFLITYWPIPLHVEQAYPRLLEQAAPLAIIALVAAHERAREWVTGPRGGAPASSCPAPPGSSRP
jgi:hypothetical protein